MNTLGGENLRVLVLDDDVFQLDLLVEMLAQFGISQVQTCQTVQSALLAFDKATVKPDLIFTDLQMPGRDGFDFISELASRSFLGTLVLMSGQPKHVIHSATLVSRLQIHCTIMILEKPVQISELTQVLTGVAVN